jgi:DGQHR domain-containing protein
VDTPAEMIVSILSVKQPIGEFYLGVMHAKDLLAISHTDMRRIEGDLDRYVGIQRKLSKTRVKEISAFVLSSDATFPTSVVLAIRGECAEITDGGKSLRLFEGQDPETGARISMSDIASILDGQHRVEGLRAADVLDFQIPVSIFVDADIADQAYLFATVNLAQTKVNKSLVYDLLDYARARSPQKSAHDITVALDKFEKSPFRELIKRLGAATEGRTGETLAQATVVNGIIPLISSDAEADRYQLAKGKRIRVDDSSYQATPFRHLWANGHDTTIAKILIEYFSAVRDRWPDAWKSRERGHILARTNGYRALIRLLKNIYLREIPELSASEPVLPASVYLKYFKRSELTDEMFSTQMFPPGTSGETALYKRLRNDLKV